MHNGSSRSPPKEIPFSVPPYLLSIEEVAEQIGSDVDNGLGENEVRERQAAYGPNAVLSVPSVPAISPSLLSLQLFLAASNLSYLLVANE